MDETLALYRPVGQAELDMVRDSAYERWPPRLPGQPFFYPVTNEQYAVEIAQRWNTGDTASGHVGYVTRFRVRKSFMDRYEPHRVGAARHTEYWIPAEDLAELNDNLVGTIEVIHRFTAD